MTDFYQSVDKLSKIMFGKKAGKAGISTKCGITIYPLKERLKQAEKRIVKN